MMPYVTWGVVQHHLRAFSSSGRCDFDILTCLIVRNSAATVGNEEVIYLCSAQWDHRQRQRQTETLVDSSLMAECVCVCQTAHHIWHMPSCTVTERQTAVSPLCRMASGHWNDAAAGPHSPAQSSSQGLIPPTRQTSTADENTPEHTQSLISSSSSLSSSQPFNSIQLTTETRLQIHEKIDISGSKVIGSNGEHICI